MDVSDQQRAIGTQIAATHKGFMPYDQISTNTQQLAAVYPELAERFGTPLIDFILEDVALNRELMQPDGIHPNAAGQEVVFANVWRVLGPLLKPRDAG